MRKAVIGIDVSKSTLDAYWVNSGNLKESYHDSFLNKQLGFRQLVKWADSKEVSDLFFCIENTGHYSRSLSTYLQKHSYAFAQINAAEIKLSMGIKREKSDQSDALMIAQGLNFQSAYTRTLYSIEFPEALPRVCSNCRSFVGGCNYYFHSVNYCKKKS